MVAKLRRLFACERGYSLMELLTVMLILGTILGALTMLFVQATSAEVDMRRRFEAQQQARTAADRIRREVHCARAVTKTDGTVLPTTPVAAVRVTLPAQCPSAGGTEISVVYDTLLVAPQRYRLRRNGTPLADFVTGDAVFQYTAPSTSSRATLRLDLPIDVDPGKAGAAWRLVADIVLRNTARA